VLIGFHTVAAIVALVVGMVVVGTEKGSRKHRFLGRAYLASMLVMVILSFQINEINGGLSIFHLISVQCLIFLSLGIGVSRFLRNKLVAWQIWHGRFMVYSYITLVVTGTAQFFDHLPFENEAVRAIAFLSVPSALMWFYFEFVLLARFRPAGEQ